MRIIKAIGRGLLKLLIGFIILFVLLLLCIFPVLLAIRYDDPNFICIYLVHFLLFCYLLGSRDD